MSGMTDFRASHPEYNDLDDKSLADRLHDKFYPDIPKEQYYEKLGISDNPWWKKALHGAEDVALGAVEAPAAVLSGIGAAAGGGAVQAATAAYDYGKELLTGEKRTPGVAQAVGNEVADKLTYHPQSATAQNLVGAANKVVGGLLTPVTSTMDKVRQAEQAATGGTTASDIIGGVAQAGAAGLTPEITKGAGDVAGKTFDAGTDLAGKVLDKVTPEISTEKAVLAQKALDIGVKIPVHMLSDNKFVRMAGEFIDNVPLSGSAKKANDATFNKYIIEQIGGDTTADALTPNVFAKAMNDSGKKIGDITILEHCIRNCEKSKVDKCLLITTIYR